MSFRNQCAVALLALSLSACTRADRNEANRDAKEAGRELREVTDGAAKKTGRAAYEIADETKEAAKKAGKAIGGAARDIKQGWDEAAREDKRR